MLYVVRSLLIVGILASGYQANAKVNEFEVKKSNIVYGTLDSKSKVDGVKNTNLKCGYFLTKGSAYASWGPSLTFFIEDNTGSRSILYQMLNGTRNLDPIETLNIQTADQRKMNKKKQTYLSIYNRNSGFMGNFIPAEKESLIIERHLSQNSQYSSQRDTNILRIGYKVDVLKKALLEYSPEMNLSCSFNKQVAKF